MPRGLTGKSKSKSKAHRHPRAWLKRNYGLAQPNRKFGGELNRVVHSKQPPPNLRLPTVTTNTRTDEGDGSEKKVRAQSMPDPDTLAMAGASFFVDDGDEHCYLRGNQHEIHDGGEGGQVSRTSTTVVLLMNRGGRERWGGVTDAAEEQLRRAFWGHR